MKMLSQTSRAMARNPTTNMTTVAYHCVVSTSR